MARFLVILSLVFSIVGVMSVAAMPRAGAPVVAVFSPASDWTATARRLVAADVNLVAVTGVPWMVIAQSDAPDIAQRLRVAGAFLVLDAAVAQWCVRRQA